jgi:UDP-galactopyranose mutase
MSRFARERRVFFLEEPVFEDESPSLRESICKQSGVHVLTPVVPHELTAAQIAEVQKQLLQSVLDKRQVIEYCAWYYTPMALNYSSNLRPALVVYDCMDELSAFAGAPPAMRENEKALFASADLVFTGGATLYEAKRKQHPSVYLFPSSVDASHFRQARNEQHCPADQREIPEPRIGYAGVIDERMDLGLLEAVAASRPDWHLVLIGPVVKIDPGSLPRRQNIHYLGMKSYSELPAYFSGWRIGMLPFALNKSTRFISPTKTPEYLSAGLQVISTPIRDVVKPYGDLGLVRIAASASGFVSEADSVLKSPQSDEFFARVDGFLSQSSWDKTWKEMNELMNKTLDVKSSQMAQSAILPAASKGASHV